MSLVGDLYAGVKNGVEFSENNDCGGDAIFAIGMWPLNKLGSEFYSQL